MSCSWDIGVWDGRVVWKVLPFQSENSETSEFMQIGYAVLIYVYDVLKHTTYILICISVLRSALNHSNVDFKRVINNIQSYSLCILVLLHGGGVLFSDFLFLAPCFFITMVLGLSLVLAFSTVKQNELDVIWCEQLCTPECICFEIFMMWFDLNHYVLRSALFWNIYDVIWFEQLCAPERIVSQYLRCDLIWTTMCFGAHCFPLFT